MKSSSNQINSFPKPSNDWAICMHRHALLNLNGYPKNFMIQPTPAAGKILGRLYSLNHQGSDTANTTTVGMRRARSVELEAYGWIERVGQTGSRIKLTKKGANTYELFYWIETFKEQRRRLTERKPITLEYRAYLEALKLEKDNLVSEAQDLTASGDVAVPKTGDDRYDRYLARLPKVMRAVIYNSNIDPQTVWREYCRFGRDYINSLYGVMTFDEEPEKAKPQKKKHPRLVPGALVSLKSNPDYKAIIRKVRAGTIYLEGEPEYQGHEPETLKYLAPPLD